MEMWTHHDSFMDLVKEVWGESISGFASFVLCHKLKLLRVCLKKWNWKVFRNLNNKILVATQQVSEVQNRLSNHGLSDAL